MSSLADPADLPSGLHLLNRSARAALNISWNTAPLHHPACGLEPDLGRGAFVTALAMARRNGRVSLAPRRG